MPISLAKPLGEGPLDRRPEAIHDGCQLLVGDVVPKRVGEHPESSSSSAWTKSATTCELPARSVIAARRLDRTSNWSVNQRTRSVVLFERDGLRAAIPRSIRSSAATSR